MAPGTDDQPGRESLPPERYGIVSLVRTHKDDGRSLILYERADGAGEPPGEHPADTGDAGGTA